MAVEPAYNEWNRASTERMRALVARLSEAEMQTPLGEHWTVAVMLAHLAFWDRRVLWVLDETERRGELVVPGLDVSVNEMLLPLLSAIPAREAARLAVGTAEELDARLEDYPAELLDAIYAFNRRWVVRALHRNDHLEEAEAALE